jgi:hypothetical protein
MDVNQGGVFQAMAIHQRIYANLIPAFPAVGAVGAAAQDVVLQNIAKQFTNYDPTNPATNHTGCTVAASCGQNFYPGGSAQVPVSLIQFPNNGSGATGVKLLYYDPLAYWVSGSAYTNPGWNPQSMWKNEAALGADAGNDGPAGPANWGKASFALVYYWDQPNYPPRPTAPGNYPTHPLNGGSAAGDPGY